jgi:lipopolysaccharide export system protein LptA
MVMLPNGREMDRLRTLDPGTLTFLPNEPTQNKRILRASGIQIYYGKKNRIERFEAQSTITETLPSAAEIADAKKSKSTPPFVMKTWGEEMLATFEEKSGEMASLRQSGNFRFEQGDRKGNAATAVLNQKENRIRLEKKARTWDSTGSLAADLIVLDQGNGDTEAFGNVRSTQKTTGDKKQEGETSTALLSGDGPIQATAGKMVVRENRQRILYEDGARLWEGPNRLHADRILIRRDEKRLEADGNVFTQLQQAETENTGDDKKPSCEQPCAPAFTFIRAASMKYSEQDLRAIFRKNASLVQNDLKVDSNELEMRFRKENEGDTVLEHSTARNNVHILISAEEQQRKGKGDKADFFHLENRVVLTGNTAIFEDVNQGATSGKELTYFTLEDRLLVNGKEADRAVSLIRRD